LRLIHEAPRDNAGAVFVAFYHRLYRLNMSVQQFLCGRLFKKCLAPALACVQKVRGTVEQPDRYSPYSFNFIRILKKQLE
jgi:hypothetical protein